MKVIKINESVKSDMKELSIQFMNNVTDYIYKRELELIKDSKKFDVEDEKDYSDGYRRGAEEYLRKLAGDISDHLWDEYKKFEKESQRY